MQDSTLNIQSYTQQLDNLLLELKKQLDVQGRATIAPVAGLDALDEYLLELNSFYYKSFHDKFFPYYKQAITDDVRNLLHIGQEAGVLKKNIMTNLKHYARLYNQVKHTAAVLRRKRQETQTLILECQKGSEERNVSLLYILKEMASGWNSFLSFERNLQTLLEDNRLLTALTRHPANVVVVDLLGKWTPDNSREVRDFNRLLASWQLAVKLSLKLQENPIPAPETFASLLSELQKIDTGWDNRKVHPSIRTWYQQYIRQTYRLYLDSLSLGDERKEHRRTGQTARQFEDWLDSLLYTMEKTMVYKSRGWDSLLNQLGLLTRTDKEYLQDLDAYASRLLHSIEELIDSLSSSSRADYQNHSQRASGLLLVSSQHLQLQIDNNNLTSRGILLAPVIERLRNQTDILESRIELLNNKEDNSVNTGRQYKTIMDSLDSHLELLGNIQDELNRLLSPRYSKNIYQDINLRIEHTVITTGSRLPSQFKCLIDEKAVDTEEADAPEGQILYEEGDIFVFQVDELRETEIPKITIVKKG